MKHFHFNIIALLLLTMALAPSVYVSAQEPTVRTPIAVSCGDIIEGEFTENFEIEGYVIDIQPGDTIRVSVEPVGGQLLTSIFVQGPTGLHLAFSDGQIRSNGGIYSFNATSMPSVDTGVIGSRGEHIVWIANHDYTSVVRFDAQRDPRGIGVYNLYIGCTLRDGTIIEPGSTLEQSPDPAQVPSPTGSGFLFPDLPEDGIELPLAQGQAQTIPVGNDIVLYTYEVANADQSATLSISRVSGDISLGVTVKNRDTGEIIFLGGLPSSNNLSVELTFPTSGTYAIGLFRLDTAERTGTSGAVQLVIE